MEAARGVIIKTDKWREGQLRKKKPLYEESDPDTIKCSIPECRSEDAVDSVKSEVAKLRAQGHKNKAIAEKLGVSFSQVMETIKQLVAEGKVKSRWPKARWTEKGSDDFKRVVKLLQSGANLAEIGEVFDVSRERARQIREKIRKRYGDQIVQPRKQPYVTLREAARELGTDPGPLQKLLQKNGMLTKNSRGIWVVQRSDLKRKKVTQHPHITQEQVCKYCGKKFPLKHRAQKVCSSECSEARRKDSRLRCFKSEPAEGNLAGWHKELWLELQRHRPPQQEEWLTLTRAAARCGLTPIQVNWLRLRKVLDCQPSETLFWRNQPVQLYRASEIEIVRQCREALLRSLSR
jgi:Mn-dependent DtxR family transcriptional regulator